MVRRRLTTTPHDSGTTACCRAEMLCVIGSFTRHRPQGEAAHGQPASIDELRAAERRLQAAQLAGDTAALDQLLDDRVLFTSGSTGACYTKHDDLHLHRTRQQILTKVSEEDLTVLVDGRTGVTWFLGTVEGTIAGRPFAARLRYTRTWIHDDHHGWRIVAAHASHAQLA